MLSIARLVTLAVISLSANIALVFALTRVEGIGLLWAITISGIYVPAFIVIRDVVTSGRVAKGKRGDWSFFVLFTGAIGITAYTVHVKNARQKMFAQEGDE